MNDIKSSMRSIFQKMVLSCVVAIVVAGDASAQNYSVPQEDAGKLIELLSRLDKTEISGTGLLKQSFLQFDEDNIDYLLQIGNRRYSVKLDDGRGTSKRAEKCDKAEFMGLNPTLGCPISFDGEYSVELKDDGADVSLTIWNVQFQ